MGPEKLFLGEWTWEFSWRGRLRERRGRKGERLMRADLQQVKGGCCYGRHFFLE